MEKKAAEQMVDEEHKRYHRRLAYIFVVILVLLTIGTFFYHWAERWRYLDALYFSSYTITTVGYGDFVPKTDMGKIFTIFYMFAGVAIALYGLSLLASHFVEQREEVWLQRINNIKLGRHTSTFWGKMKGMFSFEASSLTGKSRKK